MFRGHFSTIGNVKIRNFTNTGSWGLTFCNFQDCQAEFSVYNCSNGARTAVVTRDVWQGSSGYSTLNVGIGARNSNITWFIQGLATNSGTGMKFDPTDENCNIFGLVQAGSSYTGNMVDLTGFNNTIVFSSLYCETPSATHNEIVTDVSSTGTFVIHNLVLSSTGASCVMDNGYWTVTTGDKNQGKYYVRNDAFLFIDRPPADLSSNIETSNNGRYFITSQNRYFDRNGVDILLNGPVNQEHNITFLDNSVPQWDLRKTTSNGFQVYDRITGEVAVSYLTDGISIPNNEWNQKPLILNNNIWLFTNGNDIRASLGTPTSATDGALVVTAT